MYHKLIKSLLLFLASLGLTLNSFEAQIFIIGLEVQIELLIELLDELFKALGEFVLYVEPSIACT